MCWIPTIPAAEKDGRFLFSSKSKPNIALIPRTDRAHPFTGWSREQYFLSRSLFGISHNRILPVLQTVSVSASFPAFAAIILGSSLPHTLLIRAVSILDYSVTALGHEN